MKSKKYIKPSERDIISLSTAETFHNLLQKIYKDKRDINIGLFLSLVFTIIVFFSYKTPDNLIADIVGGISILVFLICSYGKYYYLFGEGKELFKAYRKNKEEQLNDVKCDYFLMNDKYYVYLEDGRRIEVREY